MKETDIRRYAGLMKELGLTGLEITEENSKVRLERSISAPVRETVYSVPESADNTHNSRSKGLHQRGIPHRRRVLCGSHGKCRSLCLDRGQGEKRPDSLHCRSDEAYERDRFRGGRDHFRDLRH